jgi:hypothetical protein
VEASGDERFALQLTTFALVRLWICLLRERLTRLASNSDMMFLIVQRNRLKMIADTRFRCAFGTD